MSDRCIGEDCDKCTQACPLVIVTNEGHLWGVFFDEEKDIWNCSSCFRCEASCPVDLSVRDEFFKKRRFLKIKDLPRKFQQYIENILESGNVFPIDELINERRKSLGLELIDFEKVSKELKQLLADV